MTFDVSLMVILDGEFSSLPVPMLARQVIEGGATILQLRHKGSNIRSFYSDAAAIRNMVEGTDIRLILNDRCDVALAAGAHGVHVGREDLPPAMVRSLIGPEGIVGVSAHTPAETQNLTDVDYVGVGSVFPTSTKNNIRGVLGISGLREIVESSPLPVVAIGGIGEENVVSVLETGAQGVAVLSAISQTPSPKESTRRIRILMDRWRKS